MYKVQLCDCESVSDWLWELYSFNIILFDTWSSYLESEFFYLRHAETFLRCHNALKLFIVENSGH